jgi:hypothetical protein
MDLIWNGMAETTWKLQCLLGVETRAGRLKCAALRCAPELKGSVYNKVGFYALDDSGER